jgi:hypothetical protein
VTMISTDSASSRSSTAFPLLRTHDPPRDAGSP